MKRKIKCQRCKKMKTLARFNEVDYGWGNFKKSSWCKVCDSWMNRERNKDNKKWLKFQEKLRKEFVKNGGIIERPIIGRSAILLPDGTLKIICNGWYADDEGWRKRGRPNEYIKNEGVLI